MVEFYDPDRRGGGNPPPPPVRTDVRFDAPPTPGERVGPPVLEVVIVAATVLLLVAVAWFQSRSFAWEGPGLGFLLAQLSYPAVSAILTGAVTALLVRRHLVRTAAARAAELAAVHAELTALRADLARTER